jgi:hypothetical protein
LQTVASQSSGCINTYQWNIREEWRPKMASWHWNCAERLLTFAWSQCRGINSVFSLAAATVLSTPETAKSGVLRIRKISKGKCCRQENETVPTWCLFLLLWHQQQKWCADG